jgi:nicotinamidase-related amidase
MTTLPGRTQSALLVIDVQHAVVKDAYQRDETVKNVASLVDKARAADVPVVWIQHSSDDLPIGSEAWHWVPELAQRPGEALVHKTYADSFEGTDLEQVLSGADVGRVFVAGAQTDECIRSTIHGAFVRGYDVTLVGDAHTTSDMTEWGAPAPDKVVAHTNLYWQYHEAPGRVAAVTSTEGVDFGA